MGCFIRNNNKVLCLPLRYLTFSLKLLTFLSVLKFLVGTYSESHFHFLCQLILFPNSVYNPWTNSFRKNIRVLHEVEVKPEGKHVTRNKTLLKNFRKTTLENTGHQYIDSVPLISHYPQWTQ